MKPSRRRLVELTGTPVLPPSAAARAGVRLRGALARTRRAVGVPQLTILEGVNAILDNRVLGLLVELDIPDHLDRPRDLADLAARTGAEPEPLGRILRYAAARQFLRIGRDGRYRANGVTRLLQRDRPGSWRGWVEFAGSDWYWSAMRHLDAPLRGTAPSGIEGATAHPFFDFVHDVRPDAGEAFDRAMAAGGRLQAAMLAVGLDWRDVRSVCDVGGGVGATLAILREFHSHLDAVLFDLPVVVARLPEDQRDSITAVGGSFLDDDAIPAGCDRYLMVSVIHDWDDDRAVTILRNVGAAMAGNPASAALVVEQALPPPNRDAPVVATDLLMLALADGKERTDAEYRALADRAGLTVTRTTPLPSGAVAYELRRP